MAYPNDMSRVTDELAKLGSSGPQYTNSPKRAARRLVRHAFTLAKNAADAMAADTTAYTAAQQMVMPAACIVLGARIQPQGSATANDTNYGTVNAVKGDGAAGTAVVAASVSTKTTGGGGSGNWVAGTTVALTPSATIADRRIPKGGVLSINITKTGTGVVVPAFVITIDVEEEDSDDGYGV